MMEPAKRTIRRDEWTQKWMQRSRRSVACSRLRAVGGSSSALPDHTAQVPPAVGTASIQGPQLSLGLKGMKRCGFETRSYRSLQWKVTLLSSWPRERPMWREQLFSFVSPLTQRHFLGGSPTTHGSNQHSMPVCAGWAVPLAHTEFSWCGLGHPQHSQHSHRLFLVRGWHISAWISFPSWHHQVCHSVNGWCHFYVWKGN